MRSRHFGTAALFASCLALVASAFTTSSCDSGNNNDGGDEDVINGGDGPGVDGGGSETSDDGQMSDVVDPNCNVPNCAIQIALGLEHACALAKDGTVRCWGLNSLGQLGIGPGGMMEGGAYDNKNVGNKVANLGPAQAITAGYYHTCALLQNGEVWCWGDNSRGQLAMAADGAPQPPVFNPVKINAVPTGIKQLQAGGWHTCALDMGGMLTCWGLNSAGQQGTGTGYDGGVNPNFITSPQAVPNISGATDIGLGDQFTCVSLASNVQCFGSNSFGQLARGGDAGTPPFSQTPANANGLGAMTDLMKSNGSHECALSPTPKCWGRNSNGQATGTMGVSLSDPQAVPGLASAAEIAPGGTHTCARLDDGGVVECWGLNGHGQTGDMIVDLEAGTPMPLAVSGIKNALQVASGWGDFSCALVQGGAVWCWGANFEGQLGRGGNATVGTCPTTASSNGCDNVPQKVIFVP